MKLFEIPVYAFSPKQLTIHVEKKTQAIINECISKKCPDNIIQQAIDLETYPQRSWSYNHIVGYIRISFEHGDIIFQAFVSEKNETYYQWTTSKKWFLKDSLATGYHFRITVDMTTAKIRERILEYLYEISRRYTAKGLYVDREAFDTIDLLIDYTRLKYMDLR